MSEDIALKVKRGGALRRILFARGGVCWLLFGVGFGALLYECVVGGAGLQIIPWISSGSILMGTIHTMGFGFAMLLNFTVGIYFCAEGFVPPIETVQQKP